MNHFELVKDIHAVKGLSLDGENFYLRFHIQVPSGTPIDLLDKLSAQLKEILISHNISSSTIEFEATHCEESHH